MDKKEDIILKELQELRTLTLLGVKQSLTLKEAAILTELSPSTIYKLCMKKQIPHFKSRGGGKFTYFSRKELDEWMLGRRIKTIDEVEQEAATYCATGKVKKVV